VTYLPLFLQIVKGMSPTESGLRMIPLMGGTLFTSILSGQIVSRTGKYKIFPIIGTTMVTLALFLISRMTAETTNLMIAGYMLLLGFGLGFVMQMLIVAVQNAVEYHDLEWRRRTPSCFASSAVRLEPRYWAPCLPHDSRRRS